MGPHIFWYIYLMITLTGYFNLQSEHCLLSAWLMFYLVRVITFTKTRPDRRNRKRNLLNVFKFIAKYAFELPTLIFGQSHFSTFN